MTTATASSPLPTAMSPRDWVLLFLLGLLWGGSFFFARIAVAELPPLVLVFWRVAIAAAALFVWLRATGHDLRPALPWAGWLLALGIVNNVIPFSLMFLGQTELGAGLASVLNATTPFWTIILANLFTEDEKLVWRKVGGILLGVAGTAVLVGPGLLADVGGPVWPKLALLGCAFSYGCALILARRIRGLAPPLLALGQLTGSSLVMTPLVLAVYGPAAMISAGGGTWAAVLALALASTAVAYLIFFRVLVSAGATNTSLVTLLVPASAILLGAAFLGERMSTGEALGMVLIAFGLVVIDGRFVRRFAG